MSFIYLIFLIRHLWFIWLKFYEIIQKHSALTSTKGVIWSWIWRITIHVSWNREYKWDTTLTWMQKFLDLNKLSWQPLAALSSDGRKVIMMLRKVIPCTWQFLVCLLFFLPYLGDLDLLRSINFAIMEMWFNDFSSLLWCSCSCFFFFFFSLNAGHSVTQLVCRKLLYHSCVLLPHYTNTTEQPGLCNVLNNCKGIFVGFKYWT